MLEVACMSGGARRVSARFVGHLACSRGGAWALSPPSSCSSAWASTVRARDRPLRGSPVRQARLASQPRWSPSTGIGSSAGGSAARCRCSGRPW